MNRKIGIIAVCFLLFACSKNEEKSTSSNVSLILGTPKPSTPMPSFVAKDPSKIDIPKPDLNVPLSQYVDINRMPKGFALTHIVLARKPTVTDEEKLNLLSSEYYNEHDIFKKKEIAAAQLPLINATLEEYRKKNYYHLPIDFNAREYLNIGYIQLGSYNFDTKGFQLDNIYSQSNDCWSIATSNSQNVPLEINGTKFPCHLSVQDEGIARLIEAARAQGVLKTMGTLYIFVTHQDDGKAMAVVTHAHLDLVNEKTKTPLASFDL